MKTVFSMAAIAALLGVVASGCTTIAQPKPIKFACSKLTKKEFVEKASQLLRANNYVVVEANEETGEVEGNRVPVYTGIGEGLQVNGPYVFDAIFDGTTITVNIQTVSEGKPIKSHDETSSPAADKKNFMPILVKLREMCN